MENDFDQSFEKTIPLYYSTILERMILSWTICGMVLIKKLHNRTFRDTKDFFKKKSQMKKFLFIFIEFLHLLLHVLFLKPFQ